MTSRQVLPALKPGREVWISKEQMPYAPPGFQKTWMGDLKDAINQYRGPGNMHLLEYARGWKLHVDYGDPRTPEGFLIHIFMDAPEVGVSLLFAIGTATERYEKTNSIPEAIMTFIGTGIVAYVGLKIVKEFFLWLARNLVTS